MPSEITNFNGVISLEAGSIVSSNATIIHKRSVGEDVIISRDGNLVTGDLETPMVRLLKGDLTFEVNH